ncbi:hypothetical protein Syun_029986 [Stephania yunnanensis]|uniref:Uncharacterized protein n=1 Tax=Stephania yunnanensis TaxID=152371 RepID=A0AAP0E9Z0_9MAGN
MQERVKADGDGFQRSDQHRQPTVGTAQVAGARAQPAAMVSNIATNSGDQRQGPHMQWRQRAMPAAVVFEAATKSGDHLRGLHKQWRQRAQPARDDGCRGSDEERQPAAGAA